MIISLGWRCHIAKALQQLGLRTCSLPLDWTMISSFWDVIKLFETRFESFTSIDTERWNTRYKSIYYPHFEESGGIPALERRVTRLLNILDSDAKVTFVRHPNNGYPNPKYWRVRDSKDIDDLKDQYQIFEAVLKQYYPKLNYSNVLLYDNQQDLVPQRMYYDDRLVVYSHESWDSGHGAEIREPRFREIVGRIHSSFLKITH